MNAINEDNISSLGSDDLKITEVYVPPVPVKEEPEPVEDVAKPMEVLYYQPNRKRRLDTTEVQPSKRQLRSSNSVEVSIRDDCSESFLNITNSALTRKGVLNFLGSYVQTRSFRLDLASDGDLQKVILSYDLPVVIRTKRAISDYLLDNGILLDDSLVRIGDELWPLVTISESYTNSDSVPVSRNPNSREYCLENQSFFQLCTLAVKWNANVRPSDLKTKMDLMKRLQSYAKSSNRITKVVADSKTYWMFQ